MKHKVLYLLFVSVNVPVPVTSMITLFSDQVRIKLNSQLIKSNPKFIQELLKYLKVKLFQHFFYYQHQGFNLHIPESVPVAFGLSAQYFYKPPDVFE